MDIANNLYYIRNFEYDMKVEEFAELLGVNIKTYYSWESGKTTPNMKEGFRIAEILNRDLTKIWHPVKGAFFNS